MFGGISLILLSSTIAAGWFLRDEFYITAESGPGYWLGIIGASLMILLLFYPLAKKFAFWRQLLSIKRWFSLHMLFGLLGPLCILFHCNFHLGSITSNVALAAMLTVMLSGFVGRYLYSNLHRGLYGKKIEINDLSKNLIHKIDTVIKPGLNPALLSVLTKVSNSLNNADSKKLKKHNQQLQFYLSKQQDIAQIPELANIIHLHTSYKRMLTFKRMFSLWHIVHMPLFILMIITATLHTFAVHLY